VPLLIDPSDLFSGYTVNSKISFIANSIVQIVAADPRRVALTFGYCSGTTVAISTLNNVSVVTGIQVPGTLPPVKFCLMLDGALVSQAWFGISAMAGGNILVLETFFDPGKTRF